jgi:hypothetical protein
MISGIQAIHDAIPAGSGAGVTAGFTTFGAGSAAYVALRAQLGDLAGQAVLMQHGLVK